VRCLLIIDFGKDDPIEKVTVEFVWLVFD